jgi:Ser/Thr protein kinase RdoA (MazF antagonist)
MATGLEYELMQSAQGSVSAAAIPPEVRAAYGLGSGGSSGEVVHLPSLINRTYLVRGDLGDGPRQLVLQRLHHVFAADVHLDIEAVTRHLEQRQIETPRLLRNRAGALWTVEEPALEESAAQGAAPGVWRAITYIEGVTIHRSSDPIQLASAAELLGRFHGALFDLQHEFVHLRPLHDTAQHLHKLRSALASERGRSDAEARELGEAILEQARELRLDFGEFPRRVLHGDPKLSNLLFQPGDPLRARCMIDLDTLGRGFLAYELGDALRSWTNRAGEDQLEADLDPEAVRAVLAGYARACPAELPSPEIGSAIDGLETVSLELASRFAADAILDSYFGWDATRFPSRRVHNLVRARGQFSLARQVRERGSELREIAAQALAARGI